MGAQTIAVSWTSSDFMPKGRIGQVGVEAVAEDQHHVAGVQRGEVALRPSQLCHLFGEEPVAAEEEGLGAEKRGGAEKKRRKKEPKLRPKNKPAAKIRWERPCLPRFFMSAQADVNKNSP